MSDLLFVAIDVDDSSWAFAAGSEKVQLIKEGKAHPCLSGLTKVLAKLGSKENMRICYEATHLGYTLQRGLAKKGYHCDVVAPSLIPSMPGDKVKTNKLDARKLLNFYRTGHLTPIYIPEFEDECDRDLLRSRKFLADQLGRLKKHMLARQNPWVDRHVDALSDEVSSIKRL